MRCDECKHWDHEDAKRVGGWVDRDETRFRKCKKPVPFWEATVWAQEGSETVRRIKPEYVDLKIFAQDGSDYKVSVVTMPDFFCAHFEKQ